MKGKLRSGFKLQFPKNAAFLNRGGTFVDAAVQLGIHSTDWSWAPAVLDADLDGQPDIVIGNGIVGRPNNLDYLKYSSGQAIQRQASNLELASLMPDGLMPNRAFRGRRGARFEEVSELWGLADVGKYYGRRSRRPRQRRRRGYRHEQHQRFSQGIRES